MKGRVIVIVLMLSACSKNATEPTPMQVLAFATDTAPTAQSFYFSQDSSSVGSITLALNANQFGFQCNEIEADVVFDPSILTFGTYSEGDWLKQGGAVPSFSVIKLGNNTASIQIRRPTNLGGVSGSGTFIFLTLKPASPSARGTSGVQWLNAACYPVNSFSNGVRSSHNGKITVR